MKVVCPNCKEENSAMAEHCQWCGEKLTKYAVATKEILKSSNEAAVEVKSNRDRMKLVGVIIAVAIGSVAFILALALFGFGCKPENKSVVLTNPADVKPIFDVASLAGKSPKEVEGILGSSITSFTLQNGDLKLTYTIGEDRIGVEFHENRIKSLLLFFRQKNVDSETAYRLVGLDYAKPKPAGISDIKKGEASILVSY